MQPRLTDAEIERLLKERELMRDFVQHPGAKLIAQKVTDLVEESKRKQLDADPYTEADEIKRNQQLRYVLMVMLPQLIEGICNFDPLAVDKKVPPKKRFSILEWFKPRKGERE